MKRRLFLATSGALLAIPYAVHAVSFDLACLWNEEQAAFASGGFHVVPVQIKKDFVLSDFKTEDSLIGILHHCPTDRYLVYRSDKERGEGVSLAFFDLIASETPYSLRQIGDELVKMGAEVSLGESEIGRCDCDYIQDNYALN